MSDYPDLQMRPLPHPICEEADCRRLATHELIAPGAATVTEQPEGGTITVTVTAGRYCHAHASERILAVRHYAGQ